MRYSHKGLNAIKSGLGIRLSMVIKKLTKEITGAELSKHINVSVTTISNIKNHCGNKCSFNLLLHVADSLGVNYELVIKNTNGVKTHNCILDPIKDYNYSDMSINVDRNQISFKPCCFIQQ